MLQKWMSCPQRYWTTRFYVFNTWMVSLTFVTPFIASSKVKMFTMQSEISERVPNETETKPLFTHEPFSRTWSNSHLHSTFGMGEVKSPKIKAMECPEFNYCDNCVLGFGCLSFRFCFAVNQAVTSYRNSVSIGCPWLQYK